MEIFFGDTAIPVNETANERLKENLTKYAEAEAKLNHLKDTVAYLKEIIVSDLPEEPGEHVLELEDGRTAEIKIPEKWSWDKKQLAEIYGGGAITPDCVTTSFGVNRKKYEASDETVRSALANALTIECGTPTIKVST